MLEWPAVFVLRNLANRSPDLAGSLAADCRYSLHRPAQRDPERILDGSAEDAQLPIGGAAVVIRREAEVHSDRRSLDQLHSMNAAKTAAGARDNRQARRDRAVRQDEVFDGRAQYGAHGGVPAPA